MSVDTVQGLVAAMKRRLSRRQSSTLDEDIVGELAFAQRNILEQSPTLPRFLLARPILEVLAQEEGEDTVWAEGTFDDSVWSAGVWGENTVSTDAPHNAVPLPLVNPTRQFLRPFQLWWKDETVEKGFDGKLVRRFDDELQINSIHTGESNKPEGYYWNGNPTGTLELRPYVNGGATYYLEYFAADEHDAENPDVNNQTLWTRFAGDLLLHTAGMEMAQYLRDNVALQYFAAKRQEAHRRLFQTDVAIMNADQEFVMGD